MKRNTAISCTLIQLDVFMVCFQESLRNWLFVFFNAMVEAFRPNEKLINQGKSLLLFNT